MIKAEIVADSISPVGARLTTFVLEYPRFVHAEFMTHRMFSKNAASSRAIPIEKMIEQVKTNPALPEFWGKNQSGMQAAEELDNVKRNADMLFARRMPEYKDHYAGMASGIGSLYCYNLTDMEKAKIKWIEARDSAIGFVNQLNKIGLHKQIANRILEPWFHIRIICSATEYENFFALRAHKDAQPEIQRLAYLMLEQYNSSSPKVLKEGEWHIPFGDKIDDNRLNSLIVDCDVGFSATAEQMEEAKKKIAVARCARISYLNYEGKDDYSADVKLCDRLFGSNPKHLSPTEHVAVATGDNQFYGNFKGFKQFRKQFIEENLTDDRVIKK